MIEFNQSAKVNLLIKNMDQNKKIYLIDYQHKKRNF